MSNFDAKAEFRRLSESVFEERRAVAAAGIALLEFVEDLAGAPGCESPGCRCIGGDDNRCTVAEAKIVLELIAEGRA